MTDKPVYPVPSQNSSRSPTSGVWQPNRNGGQARLSTPMPELRKFYDAFTPRFEEAIDYCDKFGLDDLPDDALNLLHLVYSMIMVSMAIEVFGTQKPADSADAVIDRIGAPVP